LRQAWDLNSLRKMSRNTQSLRHQLSPAGSQFASWDGFCIGQSGNTCEVSIAEAATVSAQFTLVSEQLNVSLTGAGTGLVTGGTPSPAGTAYPLYCISSGDSLPAYQPESCALNTNYGSQITLTAQPDANMVFTTWGGACSGNNTNCTVALNQIQNVTAQFDPAPYAFQLTLSGTGQGTVTSQPAGVSCTSGSSDGCGVNFDYGTSVTLTATASSGYVFSGWTSSLTSDPYNTVLMSWSGTSYTCSGDSTSASPCTIDVPIGTTITLTAQPAAGVYLFSQWSNGPCSGSTSPICVYTATGGSTWGVAEFTPQLNGIN
jgi:hypothetical protein